MTSFYKQKDQHKRAKLIGEEWELGQVWYHYGSKNYK
jgi:hypothetical protein